MRDVQVGGNNARLWIALAGVTGIAFFVVAFYFLFRFFTYPGH